MKKILTLAFSMMVLACLAATAQRRILQNDDDHIIPIKKPSVNTQRFYDYRGALRKNAIKIQPFHVIQALKITYERALLRKVGVGANFSLYYGGDAKGTMKFDMFAKYFLTFRAPIGTYLYTSHGYAKVQNQVFQYRRTNLEGGNGVTYDPSKPYVVERTANFATYVGCVGIGFQNVIGPKKNLIVDFGLGYQFYNIPATFKNPVVQDGVEYGRFDSNTGMLSPMSPLSVRFGVGFLF